MRNRRANVAAAPEKSATATSTGRNSRPSNYTPVGLTTAGPLGITKLGGLVYALLSAVIGLVWSGLSLVWYPCKRRRPTIGDKTAQLQGQSLLAAGSKHISNDNYEDALIAVNAAIDTMEARNIQALTMRALILTFMGQNTDALHDLDLLVKLQPNNPSVLSQRAAVHFRAENDEASVRDFDHAISLWHGKAGLAESETVKGVEIQLADAYHQRGLVHAKANRLMPAIDDVTQAYKLDRTNEQYKAHMSQLAQKLAQYTAMHGPVVGAERGK